MTTSTETLIMLLSEYDGAHGEIVRAWLSNVYATTIGHGWALGRDIRVSDNMARGERILIALEDYAFIKRVRMDLSYAPEIRHFGVGGFAGSAVHKSDSPLLFTFEPTDRLRAFMRYVRDQKGK